MDKETEKKILEEITERVLEKDDKLRREKERLTQAESTLEALDEMTELSRDEVNRIAREVRSKYEPKPPPKAPPQAPRPTHRVQSGSSVKKVVIAILVGFGILFLLILGLVMLAVSASRDEPEPKPVPTSGRYTLTYTHAIDEDYLPVDRVEEISLGSDKLFFHLTLNDLVEGRTYHYSSKVYEPSGKIAYQGDGVDITPTSSTYYAWTYYTFDHDDPPGTWKYEGYLDDERVAQGSIVVHDNRAVFTLALDDDNQPTEAITQASMDDEQLYIHVTWNELEANRTYNVRAKIFGPSGQLAEDVSGFDITPSSSTHYTWFWINPNPRKHIPGTYRFQIYLNHRLLLVKSIEIEPSSQPNLNTAPTPVTDQISSRTTITSKVNEKHRPVDNLDMISLEDETFFCHVTWFALEPKQSYQFQFKILDAGGTLVHAGKSTTFTPAHSKHYTWIGYTPDPAIDRPGEWTCECYLDGEQRAGASFQVQSP